MSQKTLGELAPKQAVYKHSKPFLLESGDDLSSFHLAYQTWGTLNETKSNVVWVCHALTGNHLVQDWWGQVFGPQCLFNPSDYFIVSVNVPGSAYGSTGPTSTDLPENQQYDSFPLLTTRDMARALELVRNFLNINRIHVLIGASLGGQVALEWGISIHERIDHLIPIATNLKHSPYGIAYNEAQRMAIEADSTFRSKTADGGRVGLMAARAIGMISYRTYRGYSLTQQEETSEKIDDFRASSYQRYQGEKLANRFNAYSYWILSKAMDSHNIFRGRSRDEITQVSFQSLVIGIDSDNLFPLEEQQELADLLPNASLLVVSSDFGHDGFLVETHTLTNYITAYLLKQNAWKNN